MADIKQLNDTEISLIFMEINRISPGLYRLIKQGGEAFKINMDTWVFTVVMPNELAPAVDTDKNRYLIRLAITRAIGHLFTVEVEGIAKEAYRGQ